jgi:hypothetical protein
MPWEYFQSKDRLGLSATVSGCRRSPLASPSILCRNGWGTPNSRRRSRADNIAHIRDMLAGAVSKTTTEANGTADELRVLALPCPRCGGRMIIIDAFGPGGPSEHRPSPEAVDSS